MSHEIRWRIISDYTGAGSFVIDGDHLIVGTDYGADCVPRAAGSAAAWKAELGSRCLGVRPYSNGSLLVTCREGMFQLSSQGDEEREKLFAELLVHEAVPHRDGLLVAAGTSIFYFRHWEKPEWRFDLREGLGQSVESVRMIQLCGCGDRVIAGGVDYDSGIGRVVVIDSTGKMVWGSEPGPLSEVFPVGDDTFVWCLTGYGKFESHRTRCDGQNVWTQEFAGFGVAREDGSIAMVVGSNEAPRWDHWEYHQLSAGGELEKKIPGKGRAPVRPIYADDGTVYFLGYLLHLDPSSSRVDYTNFFAMPQEIHFQHLVGLRKQIPEYEIFLQKVRPASGAVEVLHHIQGSFSLAPPKIVGDEIVFCDGRDIVGTQR